MLNIVRAKCVGVTVKAVYVRLERLGKIGQDILLRIFFTKIFKKSWSISYILSFYIKYAGKSTKMQTPHAICSEFLINIKYS